MTMAYGAGSQAPSWEDQIVPTLKKRLETESQYLSNRLSSSGFHEYELNEIPPSPLSPTYSMTNGSGPGAATTSQQIRTRTKSTPFFDIPPNPSSGPNDYTQAGPSRIPLPIPSRPTQQIRRPSQTSSHGSSDQIPPSRIPRLQPTPRRPSGTSSLSDNSSLSETHSPKINPNRVLSRPRSKTTLGSRPTPGRSSSGSSQERSAPISGQKPRSNSSFSVKEKLGGEGWGNESEVLSHRESFDLSRQAYPATYLRDELPPFRLAPDEAMRIARNGHQLEGEDIGSGVEGEVPEEREEGDEDSRIKRKRVESMFPIQSPRVVGEKRKGSADELGNGKGIPRSSPMVGTSIGLGQASSRIPKGPRTGSSIPRSATGGTRAALSSSQTSTARSISLGHSLSARSTSPIPTPPRMGVAAHLVPPESAYTPPKGANWDEVVLPALARKMGLGDDRRIGAEEMEEGDLAVEWDRNGTPIKWVKRQASPRLPQTQEISGGKPDRMALGESERYVNGPRSGPAFSPSFEPSPDNPLHDREISNVSEPTPTPSPSRPMRTTTAHDTSIETGPLSPAPFSTLPRRPSRGPHAIRESQTDSGSSMREGEGSGLGRKPSFLRRQMTGSRTGSTADLKVRESKNSLRPGAMGDAASSQVLGRPGEAPWSRQGGHTPGMPSRSGTIPANWEQGPPGAVSGARKQAGEDKAGDHGKGCGCVIM